MDDRPSGVQNGAHGIRRISNEHTVQNGSSGNPSSPLTSGATVKFLIDECLHTSLVQVAHAAGYAADHVNYLSLGGLKDWQLLPVIREREFTFATNNGADFLALLDREHCTRASLLSSPGQAR